MFLSIVHDSQSYFRISGPQNYGAQFTHTSALKVCKFWYRFYPLTRLPYIPKAFTNPNSNPTDPNQPTTNPSLPPQ